MIAIKRKKIILYFDMKYIQVIILIFLIFASGILADTIYLKDGRVLNGKITNQTRESVQIEINGKKIILNKNDIVRLVFGSEEERRRQEELKRQEEERKRQEELKRQEEERKRQEELKRQEEERRRQEELKRQEEERRRQEELKRQEEERRRQEELKHQEEERKRQEEKARLPLNYPERELSLGLTLGNDNLYLPLKELYKKNFSLLFLDPNTRNQISVVDLGRKIPSLNFFVNFQMRRFFLSLNYHIYNLDPFIKNLKYEQNLLAVVSSSSESIFLDDLKKNYGSKLSSSTQYEILSFLFGYHVFDWWLGRFPNSLSMEGGFLRKKWNYQSLYTMISYWRSSMVRDSAGFIESYTPSQSTFNKNEFNSKNIYFQIGFGNTFYLHNNHRIKIVYYYLHGSSIKYNYFNFHQEDFMDYIENSSLTGKGKGNMVNIDYSFEILPKIFFFVHAHHLNFVETLGFNTSFSDFYIRVLAVENSSQNIFESYLKLIVSRGSGRILNYETSNKTITLGIKYNINL